MGVTQIVDRLADAGFRQAVAETNSEVCLERESDNCLKMRSIVDQLFEERARQFQEATESLGIARPRPEDLEDVRTWAETRDKKVRAASPRFAALADLTSRLGFPTDNRCCW
jgi:hypothetical protein